MDTKSFLKSRTLWGLIISGLGMILSRWGFDLDANKDVLIDVVLQGMEFGGLAIAAWGRVAASKKVVIKMGL